jgi:hypothetical protein
MPSHRQLLALMPLTAAAWLALVSYPVGYGFLRAAVLSLALLFVVQIVVAVWPWVKVRRVLLGILAASTVFLALPGRKHIFKDELLDAYLQGLRSFEGTPYVWGGENRYGIDCSGLVRRAWAEALLKQGIRHLDSGLLRTAFGIWWHDLSARALRDETRRLTMRTFESPSINATDHTRLTPGDLAATQDGVHIMTYLGEWRWIEADPGAKQVIKVQAPTTQNTWFTTPVVFLRWKQLSSDQPRP